MSSPMTYCSSKPKSGYVSHCVPDSTLQFSGSGLIKELHHGRRKMPREGSLKGPPGKPGKSSMTHACRDPSAWNRGRGRSSELGAIRGDRETRKKKKSLLTLDYKDVVAFSTHQLEVQGILGPFGGNDLDQEEIFIRV